MKHEYLNNKPLDEAVETYNSALKAAGLSYKTEHIACAEAFGRVTAHAVYAQRCCPHYNAAAMDGIAVRAILLEQTDELHPVTLDSGDYVFVDTGDPLPSGADCVIMTEDILECDGGAVTLKVTVVPWQNVRQIGEDLCAGDMIIESFCEITPAIAGALIAGGVTTVEVVRRPRVGILPTGDEIVEPTQQPMPGEIVEFNSVILRGMLAQWGALPIVYPIVPDNPARLLAAVKQAASDCDMVLILAGSSAGRDDYTAQTVRQLGAVVHHGLAIKPGKPAVLGHIGPVPCIGVPGYSVSAILVMEKVVHGIVDRLLCRGELCPPQADAVAARKIVSSLKYREFVRARLSTASGKITAIPLNRGAGVITSFTKAHAMMDIPQNCEGLEAGERVRVELLINPADVDGILSVTGSHDPLIDEIADMFRRAFSPYSVSSAHVGSMGAIAAIKSSQAHIGGVHLLDEERGEYNIPYLHRHFPEGGVVLIEGVGRTQGLLTAKTAEGTIDRFEDIAKTGVSYVNRQRGSGTRILCDYLAKKAGLNTANIYGYDREEFTHTGVAALVAAGSADAGLGIFAAAKVYDLRFVPIAEEQYDFLCRADALESDAVKAFIAALASEEFAARIRALGGYTLNNPGTVKYRV